MASGKKRSGALSRRELAAWGGFLHTYKVIISELDGELDRELGLPLSSYEVLLKLASADGERLRMSELAEAVVLTRSGMTRLVDRLERGGLVERRRCLSDARGLECVLTPAGRQLFVRAQKVHIAGVRDRFFSVLSKQQQRNLADAWSELGPRPEPEQASAACSEPEEPR